ncbi:MAG: sigma-54 dependent transcriptional regulator [Gammaproteobacteria bacterium]|nr:sigma-54 dependent transcriptional regulator [Gammaproteobacteria bacterium]MDH3464994.1 sigma-54 dependent transcriptional regulator [Gammaproteobacteria bacterium]
MANVLIVDDEPDIRELLGMTLERMEIESRSADSVGAAERLLADNAFDLCLTDMRLPDGTGIELVRHIQSKYPELPVAVITAYGSMETAVESLRAGAFDCVSKPIKLADLRNLVTSALRLGTAAGTSESATAAGQTLLGESDAMRSIRALIAKVARSQAPVYISGESGTGKELVAKLIHGQGPRADKPFVPVNCGAIPSELMESEFFGHKKGSFTGAVADKAGLFQAAHGGTLFLDEIADLPAAMQVKLLRVIQEKAVRPIGGREEMNVDVRILSATHKSLADLVQNGDFRQDLFYRINVIEVQVPPLRERREDIGLLASHLLTKLAAQNQTATPQISASTLDKLSAYGFPGNVRELENILERALALSEGEQIESDALILPLRTPDSAEDPILGRTGESLEDYVSRVERLAIEDALKQTGGNKTAAAKLLGITFRSLRYKLDKLGVD